MKSWRAHVLSLFGESKLVPGAEIFITSLPSLLFLPLPFQTEIQAAVRASPQNPCAQPLRILNVA